MNPLIKKLIRDYNYLAETLEDVKAISSTAEGEFKSALIESDPDAAKALMPEVDNIIEHVNSIEEQIENISDPKFKKLFRKIAVKCHPDKLINLDETDTLLYKRMYGDLTFANKNHDWGMLLKLAMEINIDFGELNDTELENIIKNVDVLRLEIKKYENSMAYSWYIQNDENARTEYLAICANIFKKSMGTD